MKIFSGTSNKPLAEKIAKNLNLKLSEIEFFVFPDGERRIRVLENVSGEDTIVVQSTSSPADENYMELFFIVDALKRSGAKSVTAVIPYFGYQRQDHVFRTGEAVSANVIAKILETVGIDKLIAIEPHSRKIKDAFKIPVVHLSALTLFAETIKGVIGSTRQLHVASDARSSSFNNQSNTRSLNERLSSNSNIKSTKDVTAFNSLASGSARSNYPLTLVSPDMGGVMRVKLLSEMLGNMPFAVIEKNRDLASGKVSASHVEGEIGKNVIIVDDMISSGGTIAMAAKLLKEKGAENIYVFATHPVFSGNAPEVLQESLVKEVYVTDTILVSSEKHFPKLKILSVSEIIASEIKKSV